MKLRISLTWLTALAVLTISTILSESGGATVYTAQEGTSNHGNLSKRTETLWDDGLFVMSSSGSRKERKSNERRNNDDEDDKKTLSQQVKEGKYGLIQNEIYSTEPKRPGIISYMSNPDTPRDNVKNLGGLDEDEIWLAENHVLVLRGGSLPERELPDESEQAKWPPIDDYQAPKRPVKIPFRPKVPPPFPVQLTDGGPVQIIGTSDEKGEDDNGTEPRGFLPGEGPFFPVLANGSTSLTPAFAAVNSSTFKPIVIPDKLPGSFYPPLPPGAVIVPPPPPPPSSNRSDYDDEEDQSIYYPPPYSFVYHRDNDSTAIPPGPLVPGIILPPPPDFFSQVDEKKTTTIKEKYTKRLGPTRSLHTDHRNHWKPTTKVLVKSSTEETTTQKTEVPTVPKPSPSRPSFSRYSPKTTLRKPVNVLNTTKEKSPVYAVSQAVVVELTTPSTINLASVVGNQVSEMSSTEKGHWSTVVNRKAVPLLAAYYVTTTPTTVVEQAIEATPASAKHSIQSPRLPEQTSYFFYGEPSNKGSSSAAIEDSTIFQGTTTTEPSASFYKVNDPLLDDVQENVSRVKLLESMIKDPRAYHYTEPEAEKSPMPHSGSSFYYQTRGTYLTATPGPFYQTPRRFSKPKPIYQYSFESADYQQTKQGSRLEKKKKKKRRKKKKEGGEEEEQPQHSELFYEYQYEEDAAIQNVSEPQFDYDTDTVLEQQVQTNRLPYKATDYFAVTTVRSPAKLSSTLEPHRAYFTKQDEQLLDDVTKEYFTMFGKKLSGKRGPGSTTPVYATEKPKFSGTIRSSRYKSPKVKVHYGGQPYSLEGDTLVNYRRGMQLVDPDSEFIVIGQEKPSPAKLIRPEEFRVRQVLQSDNQVEDYQQQQQQQHQQRQNSFIPMEPPRSHGQKPQYPNRPISLADDIAVNYQNPRPPINPDAEFIGPLSGQTISSTREKSNSYFAYSLPGDGGHFYFLTPQTVTQRHASNSGYLYPQPRGSRLLRRRRGPLSV